MNFQRTCHVIKNNASIKYFIKRPAQKNTITIEKLDAKGRMKKVRKCENM